MLGLNRRTPDLFAPMLLCSGRSWIIATLRGFGIEGMRRENRVGVWVARPDKPCGPSGGPAEDKIAAIGVRVRRWITFHGMSLNVAPDLEHYSGIVPCGISAAHHGVTSFADLGVAVTMDEVDRALAREFEVLFGRTTTRRVARSHRRQHREAVVAAAAGRVRTARRRERRPHRRCALAGPRRHASTTAATADGLPANTASTVPSRRLRTQPARPRSMAICSVQAR